MIKPLYQKLFGFLDSFHRYLIHNSKCIVPDYESFGNKRPYYGATEYEPCTYSDLLTTVTAEDGKVFLLLQTTIVENLTISCCYCDVTFDENENNAIE